MALEPIYGFETQVLTLDGEFPNSITEGWQAKPVGRSHFKPTWAEERFQLAKDLVLYHVRHEVFVLCRFDPMTQCILGARMVFTEEANELRKALPDDVEMRPLHDDDILILRCLNDNAPRQQLFRDVANKTGISQKSVGKRIKELSTDKLIVIVNGGRSGVTISAYGKAVLGKLQEK